MLDQSVAQYEIHLHGDVPLRHDVELEQIESALTPLWRYSGAPSFKEGNKSYYGDEPGIVINRSEHMLSLCWTVQGDDSFAELVPELCEGLNGLAREGAPIEVSFIDLDDETDVDEYQLLFVGPNAQAISTAQRDLLVKEMMDLMERHFDAKQLDGVISEIDRLFEHKDQVDVTLPHKSLWTGIPFSGLCEPTKKRLH